MEAGKGKIKRLSEAVVNRIAAGEVIQRPANAIKEMMENSMDAGSTSITVTLKAGGLKMLQIQDNGHGIDKGDMGIVCERFTTSKLTKFEDLSSISTHGFRGEALASISHVGHLSIVTRTEDSPCAYRAAYTDGKLCPERKGQSAAPKPCAGNIGTQITVEDLFYNVPTRKRALKSASDELNRVADIVSRYAVHNSKVSFTLRKHGDTSPVVRTTATDNQVESVRSVYGSSVANELLEIDASDDRLGFRLRGLITNANYSVKKPVLLLFINNRSVESLNIRRALDAVYANYLPRHTHCFAYIALDIKPEMVDVNVHPTKKEVHFLHEDEIIALLQETVGKRLIGANRSRTFKTQSLLPTMASATKFLSQGTAQTDSQSAAAEGKPTGRGVRDGVRVYDHDLVRTDSRSQKLDKFLVKSAPLTSQEIRKTTRRDAVPQRGESHTQLVSSFSKHSPTSTSTSASAVEERDDEPDMVWNPIKMKMVKNPRKKAKTYAASTASVTSAMGVAHDTRGAASAASALGSRSHQGRSGAINNDDDEDGIDGSPELESSMDHSDSTQDPHTHQHTHTHTHTHTHEAASTSSQVPAKLHRTRTFKPWPETQSDLITIATLRANVMANQHSVLRSIFAEHVFVGCVDAQLSLLQYQRHLYAVRIKPVLEALFYQLALRGFGGLTSFVLKPPAPLPTLVMAALDSPETNWSEADGPKDQLCSYIVEFLGEKADMLREYLAIDIQGNELHALPIFLEGHAPQMSALPRFLIRLATEVDWDSEQACFHSLCEELGTFYAQLTARKTKAASNSRPEELQRIRNTLEHVIHPALRTMFAPPKPLADAGAVLQVVDLKDLYKVFERC
eukprot:m.308409 g.308409  ORF g.308409 m.308409 type:complete len:850 (+) comp15939_c3_seq30:194-2743(+)